MMEEEEKIKHRIEHVLPYLDERQSRLYLSAEAESIGWGGKTLIAKLSGKSRMQIGRGTKELHVPDLQVPEHRVRRAGGGRKKEVDKQPGLVSAVMELVEPHTVGNPESFLLWTSKSVKHLQSALQAQGFKISHELVRQILINKGFSLQTNKKTHEGGEHVDRDAQFQFIGAQSKTFILEKQPVISVDCKKKELIGNHKNAGREWQPVKHPVEVNVYDFVDKTNGKASPYGVYDIANNTGFVSVGISSDTAAFAVEAIRRWWNMEGKNLYQQANSLYINADGGGSNGRQNKLWKKGIQDLSNETGLTIYVSHFPPGTSKWNKIEHRLFSYISMNWRGKPLESLAVILGLIGGTTSANGLTVKPVLDENIYQTGVKISKEEMKTWNIKRNDFHGEWNYSFSPIR